MIEVEDLSNSEIDELLGRIGYGHLGCSRDDRPYVIPVHYAYHDRTIFIYTTEGKKSEIIESNPHVCLQSEKVDDNQHWESVIIEGEAEAITEEAERQEAFKAIIAINPTLTPAVSIHWMDDWVRENVEVIYRIRPETKTGRRSLVRTQGTAKFVPEARPTKGSIY